MKFSEYPYVRPNIGEIKKTIESLVSMLEDPKIDTKEIIKSIEKSNIVNDKIQSQFSLASIRHTINVQDEFYEKEDEFINENGPIIAEIGNKLVKALLVSPHRKKLEKHFGELLFLMSEVQEKTFIPEIVPLLQKENEISSKYGKLRGSAEIQFQGKVYNLSQMIKFTRDSDRQVRKSASEAVSKFYQDHEAEFDDIYDKLVEIRTEIAKKLGHENFIQLGYDRMGRLDFNAKDVEGYRKQIREVFLPFVNELFAKQQKRIGYKDFYYYDVPYLFKSGNATPKGTTQELVYKARDMYHKMSKETGEFFDFMIEHELLDLDSKPGKVPGGYCTYLPEWQSPFIFSNFNGTTGDIDVLTHEAGHAFMAYTVGTSVIPEYRWPTYEACEIHSMSMEFFAWPYMASFFPSEDDKYRYGHLEEAIKFLPYGALVDHFQTEVYTHPELSKEERKKLWRDLEKIYKPTQNYDDNSFLDKGTFWYRQGHIFESPFYYIDYTLAQVCAFQFLIKDQANHKDAWQTYVKLCKLGGSKTFLNLLKEVGLDNPFIDGTLAKIVPELKKILSSIDDSKF